MNDAATYGGASPEIQAAAETLRSVEHLRKRGESITRARPTSLWIWAGAFLAALPFALFPRDDVVFESGFDGALRLVVGGPGDEPRIRFFAIGVAALLAAAATIIDFRRQPAHPARGPKREISVGEGIIVAAAVLVLGPLLLSFFFMAATSGAAAFVGASVLAIIVGMYIRNRVLSLAAVLGLFGVIIARFAWTDQWAAVGCAGYVLVFSVSALGLMRSERVAG